MSKGYEFPLQSEAVRYVPGISNVFINLDGYDPWIMYVPPGCTTVNYPHNSQEPRPVHELCAVTLKISSNGQEPTTSLYYETKPNSDLTICYFVYKVVSEFEFQLFKNFITKSLVNSNSNCSRTLLKSH